MNKHNRVTADQGRVTISTILKKAPGAVLALMVLGGCMNPLSERPSSGGGFTDAVPDGYGRVTVTLAGAGARTLYPAEGDFGDIILSFRGPDGASHDTVPVTGGSATVDLALGSWTITATAYAKAPPTVAAAWGSEGTTIGAGDNDPVHIILAPYTGPDAIKGTLRYAIGISGDGGAIEKTGLSSATITVTKTNGDDPDEDPVTKPLTWDGAADQYADTLPLDAGYYLVQVKLTRGALSATRTWVAHLYPGLKTLAECDFGEADLKPALMGTVRLDGSAVYGETLTANPDLEGTGDLSYVWKRGDSATAADTVIDDESAAAYTLTAADVGKHIAVEVSRTGYDGIKRAVIGPVAPVLISAAAVTGLAAPATGASPAVALGIPDGAHYTVASPDWEQTDSPGPDTWDGGVFKPLATYQATITLQAAKGYKFTDGIKATVNGGSLPKGSIVSDGTTGGSGAATNTLTFTVSFPATTGGTAAVEPEWDIPEHTLAITKSPNTDLIGPAETLTLTLTGDDYSGYSNFQWTVNGDDVAADAPPVGGAASSYIFKGEGRSLGTYTVGVRAQQGGLWYENQVKVSVGNMDLGDYAGSFTAVVEGGILKSITPTGKDPILIGRKAGEPITLNLDASGALQFREKDGESIPIGSYAEFQLINTATGGLSGTYKQEADLDLMGIPPAGVGDAWSGQQWTAVGTFISDPDTNRFAGTFDGNGKAISNLYINNDRGSYQGLFGSNKGTVKNVHIASGSVTGNNYVGGVVGQNYQGAITACSNNGSVSGGIQVGGVAGYTRHAITACYNTGSVSGVQSVGGVVGYIYNSDSSTITACYNTGPVTASNINVGGVVGRNSSGAAITACYNTGPVSGSSAVGGVVGYNYRANVGAGAIIACYNTGPVSANSTVGSVVGYNNGPITACYWTQSDVAGSTTNGGGGTKFSDSEWPTLDTNAQWAIGDSDGTPGNYWQSLGGWGSPPVYPKLWWEKD